MYGMVSAGTFGVRADATEKFCSVYQKLSTDKMEKELVVIHLGNYLENNQTFRKRE